MDICQLCSVAVTEATEQTAALCGCLMGSDGLVLASRAVTRGAAMIKASSEGYMVMAGLS